MKIKHLLLGSVFISGGAMAADANLSYNYADIGAGIGKLELKTLGRKYDYKAITFGGAVSMELGSNYYLVFDINSTKVNDKDRDGGVILDIDGSMKDLSAQLGYAVPVADSTDLTFEIGATHMRDDLTGKFIPGSDYKRKESDNGLAWGVGLRSIWPEYGFEGYVNLAGVDDNLGFQIGGPMYITENIALDIHYNYAVKREHNNKTKLSSLGLSLRGYF